MEVCVPGQEREEHPARDMVDGNFQQGVDYDCLRKYDENNEHFSMGLVLENQEGEQQRPIGYSCIYRNGERRVTLEFRLDSRTWKMIADVSDNGNENLLDFLFDDEDMRSLFTSFTLDQQIQLIAKRLDRRFAGSISVRDKQLGSAAAPSACVPSVEEPVQPESNTVAESLCNEVPEPKVAPAENESEACHSDFEKDYVDFDLRSLMIGSRTRFPGLAPPPVVPRRSRQNSAFSQCSVRYASFVPPPTAPVCQRRVIESIVLEVKRRKRLFEKIVDALKRVEQPTMHQLGLEFLRIYDGKFNYREGHEILLPFRKKSWLLTIVKINCVDCPAGEIGPRSLLILRYKGRYTSVHI